MIIVKTDTTIHGCVLAVYDSIDDLAKRFPQVCPDVLSTPQNYVYIDESANRFISHFEVGDAIRTADDGTTEEMI